MKSHPKVTQYNHPKVTLKMYKNYYLINCKYCSKNFKYKQGRWKHEQKCQVKSNNDEIMELKKKLKDTEDKINNTQLASTITNNNNKFKQY